MQPIPFLHSLDTCGAKREPWSLLCIVEICAPHLKHFLFFLLLLLLLLLIVCVNKYLECTAQTWTPFQCPHLFVCLFHTSCELLVGNLKTSLSFNVNYLQQSSNLETYLNPILFLPNKEAGDVVELNSVTTLYPICSSPESLKEIYDLIIIIIIIYSSKFLSNLILV